MVSDFNILVFIHSWIKFSCVPFSEHLNWLIILLPFHIGLPFQVRTKTLKILKCKFNCYKVKTVLKCQTKFPNAFCFKDRSLYNLAYNAVYNFRVKVAIFSIKEKSFVT